MSPWVRSPVLQRGNLKVYETVPFRVAGKVRLGSMQTAHVSKDHGRITSSSENDFIRQGLINENPGKAEGHSWAI